MWGAWGVERTQKRFKTSLTTKSCLMRWSMRILFVAIFALFRESTKRTELTYLGPSNCFILSFNNAIEPHRYNVGHSYLNIQGKTVWVKVFDFIRAKSCFPTQSTAKCICATNFAWLDLLIKNNGVIILKCFTENVSSWLDHLSK